jgi:hypothetical protein
MIHDPLARRGTAVAPCHGEGNARFIDEFQPVDVQCCDRLPECGAQGLDAFGLPFRGVKRLFFRESRSRCNSRQMVAGLTCGPWAATTWSRSSSRVASGCWATAFRRVSVWSLRRRAVPPA